MKCYQNLPIILKTLKTINVQDSNLYSGIQVLPNRPINFINQPGKKIQKKRRILPKSHIKKHANDSFAKGTTIYQSNNRA